MFYLLKRRAICTLGLCAHFLLVYWYIILSFTYVLFVIVFHIVCIMCLLNAFWKTSMEPIKIVNSS